MIGIVLLILIVAVVGIALIGAAGWRIHLEWMRARRKIRALQTGAPSCIIWPNHYQPMETVKAWREPLQFEAQTVCPHCGNYATHTLAEPTIEDHEDAVTVRRCGICGHIWGEK